MLFRLARTLPFLLVAIALGVFCYGAIDPVGFRLRVFQPVRDLDFFLKELQLPRKWSKVERISVPQAEKIILDPRSPKGISIVADLREPAARNDQRAPAMLVLHGSSPWGRKNGLVQLLALRLSERGWIVLTPDARGFGDSGTPQVVQDPQAWEVAEDVRLGIDYLSAHPLVDLRRIYVLGHSMGAGHALEGALRDGRVAGMILLGPSRFIFTKESGFK
jgi:dipeptidyl aminopeptidase/acylaminoacyl peptidase